MISKIVINKNVATVLDQYDKAVETTDYLTPYLFVPVEFAEGTTFYDLWQFIIRELPVYDAIYYSVLGRYPLSLWANQATGPCPSPSPPEDPKSCMTLLEIYWVGECNNYNDKPVWDFDLSADFHGWGPQFHKDENGVEVNYEGGWSLSFSTVRDLLAYPIKLRTTFNLEQCSDKHGYSKQETPYTKRFLLAEVLQAIFDEISFFGAPEQQAKTKEEVCARAQEAMEHQEKPISLEDLAKEMENKALGS